MKKHFRLLTLYHKFMRSKGISYSQLTNFAHALNDEGFIVLKGDWYEPTEKLTSLEYRKELFKLVNRFVQNEKLERVQKNQ